MRDENCIKCSLSLNCQTVCIHSTKQSAKLMIIGDMPSEVDDKNGSILSSKKDAIVTRIITEVLHETMDEVYMTYAVKCRPKDNAKPTAKELTACKSYLLEEINRIRPVAILTLGDIPTKLLGIKGAISKERGKGTPVTFQFANSKLHEGAEQVDYEPTEDFTTQVIPAFSPGYIDYNNYLLKQFAEDIQKAYNTAMGVDMSKTATRIVQVETMTQFYELVEYVKRTGMCSFDYETTEIAKKGLGVLEPGFKVTLISICFQHGSAYTIAMNHKESTFDEIQQQEIWDVFFKEILENPDIHKVMHNAKFEMHVSRLYGCARIRGRIDDTMLMHHLWDETVRHGLKEVGDYFYPQFSGYEDEVQRYKWDDVPLKVLSPYGGTDADLTLRLRDLLESYLLKDEKLYRIYRNLTMYANRALFNLEWRGMSVDKTKLLESIERGRTLLQEQEDKLRQYRPVIRYEEHQRALSNKAKIAELEALILQHEGKTTAHKIKLCADANQMIKEIKAGILTFHEPINFGSPDQLSELLYGAAGFHCQKVFDRRKKVELTGTGKEILEQLKDPTGFIAEFRLWRSVGKILSTYLEGLYDRLDPDCKVHTSLLLHGTVTGRLSSQNPNLQNLPNLAKLKDAIAIEMVSMVKRVFVPRPGSAIVQADYQQAELRIIADFANDQVMLEAYANNLDLHALTGSKFMGLTLEDFYQLPKDDQKKGRTDAKAGNFGLIYGMSAEGLIEYARSNYHLILTMSEAMAMRKAFFDLYRALPEYHKVYIAKAEVHGYVRTLYGRKRNLPDININDGFKKGEAERAAINSPIQGSAGEFTVFALALCEDRLDPDVWILNTVHDSIIFDIPIPLLPSATKVIRYTMENLPNIQYFKKDLKNVAMKIDIESSLVCWKEMQPYED